MYKSALLVLLTMGASVAVADDLDELLELEDKTKNLFDHQLRLRKIQNILNGVSSACLEHKCFSAGELKIKIETTCRDCKMLVDLGGLERIVSADNTSQLLNNKCMHIGQPRGCDCLDLGREITRLHVKRQRNDNRAIAIKSVELLWVTDDGSVLPIFKESKERRGWINAVNFSLPAIKNNGAFRQAKVGSCQN